MSYEFAFIDVDSLIISPNGRTYTCQPHINSISSKLYNAYGVISGIISPLVYSLGTANGSPDNMKRRDYLSIPTDVEDNEWKKAVSERYKFYISKEKSDDAANNAMFDVNKNALECIKLIDSKEWIVFGTGIKHGVDHVITTLIESGENVKYIPELIMPSETESIDILDKYILKWEEKGAEPMSYLSVTALKGCRKS